MDKIGFLVSEQKYIDVLIGRFVDKKITQIFLNIWVITLKDKVLYFYLTEKGQNSGIIGCSKLYHFCGCEKIISFDSCVWVHSKERIDVGKIIKFNTNIINYAFKEKPDFYHYDDCGISSYPDNIENESNLLLTCNEYISSAEVLDNLNLQWKNYDNIFYDGSAYGIQAYCKSNCIDLVVLRFVKGYVEVQLSDEILNKIIEELLIYCK